jgi:hypothetical protein
MMLTLEKLRDKAKESAKNRSLSSTNVLVLNPIDSLRLCGGLVFQSNVAKHGPDYDQRSRQFAR